MLGFLISTFSPCGIIQDSFTSLPPSVFWFKPSIALFWAFSLKVSWFLLLEVFRCISTTGLPEWINLAVLKHTRGVWYIFWVYWGDHSGYVLTMAKRKLRGLDQLAAQSFKATAIYKLWGGRGNHSLQKGACSHKSPFLKLLGFSHEGFCHIWIWQFLINMYISSVHSDLTVCESWFFLCYSITRLPYRPCSTTRLSSVKSIQILKSRAWVSYLITNVLGTKQSLKFPTLRSCCWPPSISWFTGLPLKCKVINGLDCKNCFVCSCSFSLLHSFYLWHISFHLGIYGTYMCHITSHLIYLIFHFKKLWTCT